MEIIYAIFLRIFILEYNRPILNSNRRVFVRCLCIYRTFFLFLFTTMRYCIAEIFQWSWNEHCRFFNKRMWFYRWIYIFSPSDYLERNSTVLNGRNSRWMKEFIVLLDSQYNIIFFWSLFSNTLEALASFIKI